MPTSPHTPGRAGRLLMLNGWNCPPDVWGGLDAALSAAGFAPEPMELPGWGAGATPPRDADPRGLAAALAGRVRAAGPVAGVVGYSLGAQVALCLARAMPRTVPRVVAIAPPVVPTAPHTLRPRSGREVVGVPFVGTALLRVGMIRLRRSPAALAGTLSRMAGDPDAIARTPVLADFAARMAERVARTSPSLSVRTMAGALRADLRPVAPGVRAATLLVVGELDPLCRPGDCRALQAVMPDARVLSVDGAGHFVHFERPDAAVPGIIAHLRGGA